MAIQQIKQLGADCQLSLEESIFSLLLTVGAIHSTAAGAEGGRGDKVLSGDDVRLDCIDRCS